MKKTFEQMLKDSGGIDKALVIADKNIKELKEKIRDKGHTMSLEGARNVGANLRQWLKFKAYLVFARMGS